MKKLLSTLALLSLGALAFAAATLIPPMTAHAADATSTPPGVDWTFWIALVAAVLGGLSTVLHVVAPRTKNTVDDAIRDDIDKLLAFMREQSPQSVSPPARDPQAGRAGLAPVMVLALIGAALTGMVISSCTASQARQTAATGAVAALDCEAQHFDAAVMTDLRTLAEAKVQGWISGKAPANIGALVDKVKADLGAIKSDAGRCAITGVLAAATTIASPTPGEAIQGLASAPTGPDPVAVRAAFAQAARELEWAPVKVAGGMVL